MFRHGILIICASLSMVAAPAVAEEMKKSEYQYGPSSVYLSKFDSRLGTLKSVSFDNYYDGSFSFAAYQPFDMPSISAYEPIMGPAVHIVGTMGDSLYGSVKIDKIADSYFANPETAVVSFGGNVKSIFTGDFIDQFISKGDDDFISIYSAPSLNFGSLDGTALQPTYLHGTGYYISSTVTYVYDTASAVPEPSTWAMMLIGFGMMAYGLRKRSVIYATA
jgi:hypothetical protein